MRWGVQCCAGRALTVKVPMLPVKNSRLGTLVKDISLGGQVGENFLGARQNVVGPLGTAGPGVDDPALHIQGQQEPLTD